MLIWLKNQGKVRYRTFQLRSAWATREQNIALLKSGKEFDLLVLGGGATGCGCALDAQTRGLNVALLEKEDFASGTSSRSTKLIWAGSRYLVLGLVKLFSLNLLWSPLKTVDEFWGTFKMVLGCHQERRSLIELNPHLITWLPIAVSLHDTALDLCKETRPLIFQRWSGSESQILYY